MVKDKPKPAGKPSIGPNLQPKQEDDVDVFISCKGDVCLDRRTGKVFVDLTKADCLDPSNYSEIVEGLWKAEDIEYKLRRPIKIEAEAESPKEA